MQKIHFINRIDRNNAGDWYCCPLNYYYGYFKKYNLFRHDIDFVDYNEIEKDDVVILGGSGMLDVTYSFNEAINKILDRCDTVIAWSIGFNTHDAQWYQGHAFPTINLQRFSLIGIRDYGHPCGVEYLPCPSALALEPFRFYEPEISRKYGVIEHSHLPIRDLPFEDKITNKENIAVIAAYICTSEIIITNSWHCAYWALLLKKKVIVVNKFSTKFDYFKYKPEFISTAAEKSEGGVVQSCLEKAARRAKSYDCYYEEAVRLNHAFFLRIKEVVEDRKIPENSDYQNLYQLTIQQLWNRHAQLAQLNARINELQERFEKIEKSERSDEGVKAWIRKIYKRIFS